MERAQWARDLAGDLLAESLPRRWAHSRGVGRKAESITDVISGDPETLICAAWLHDIGYSPDLAKTGLHSFDGARYLRDAVGVSDEICRLVAHHSCAIIEARNRGLAADLLAEFPDVPRTQYDALTYCDMTTSPDGDSVSVARRLEEILLRYGVGDLVYESIQEASVQIRASVDAVRQLLGKQLADG